MFQSNAMSPPSLLTEKEMHFCSFLGEWRFSFKADSVNTKVCFADCPWAESSVSMLETRSHVCAAMNYLLLCFMLGPAKLVWWNQHGLCWRLSIVHRRAKLNLLHPLGGSCLAFMVITQSKTHEHLHAPFMILGFMFILFCVKLFRCVRALFFVFVFRFRWSGWKSFKFSKLQSFNFFKIPNLQSFNISKFRKQIPYFLIVWDTPFQILNISNSHVSKHNS